MKRLVILGSTGSIGTQALSVVAEFPDRVSIVALAAKQDDRGLFEQVRRFQPEVCCLVDRTAAARLAQRLASDGSRTQVLAGTEGLVALAGIPQADTVLVSVAGNAALEAALAAIAAGKRVAIATKEILVSAGHIVMQEAARTGAEILPVDSEHSAVFQCLQGERLKTLRRIVLTASGGPFLDYTPDQLQAVSVADALAHPTWRMGSKITVDSATLMNKGLEVIEARWLFGVDLSQVEVVVHRQSIVHSLVEFQDHSVIAQMGYPDMRLPIQYALFYPERVSNHLKPLDLPGTGALTFERPDKQRFPCLELAYEAARVGGSMPCALNAANEAAVGLFLRGCLGFVDIATVNARVMERHDPIASPNLEQIQAVDRWARAEAERVAQEGGGKR